MAQTILTFITEVERHKVRDLEGLLHEVALDLRGNPHLPFASLTRLHFASLVVFPEDRALGRHYAPYLVFENNFDGSLDAYLEELLRQAGPGLHRIYSHCVGYRARGADDADGIAAYLRAHVVRPSAFHIGNVGRSAERIRREAELRGRLEACLDDLVARGLASVPTQVRRRLQEVVETDPRWAWVRQVRPRQTLIQRVVPRARIGTAALVAVGLAPALIPIGLIWALVLRRKERADAVWTGLADHEHVRALREREDKSRFVQNHMASMTHVKPGPLRRLTLRLVLWLANLVARTSTNGTLSGIPSIHFAHWSQIDSGRRLLFLSNFDGSWENYLDDFIDKASSGLTAIWGNTMQFPRVRWLFFDGSRDGPNFKAIARAKQYPSNVWYSAYRDLTVQQIDKNSAIREQLFAPLDDASERAWLRNF